MTRAETAGMCLLAILLVASCHAQDDQCPSMPANLDFEKGTNSWCLPKALWRVSDDLFRIWRLWALPAIRSCART